MTITHQTVLDENGEPTAALIPWGEFVNLREQLENTEEGKLHPEWRAELDRRSERLSSGAAKPIPHEVVISTVRERLEKLGDSKQSA